VTYHSWQRCIVEAAVLWLVVIPALIWLLDMVVVLVSQISINNVVTPFIWRALADPISALCLLGIVILTAGATRAQRKNLFDK
jgi:hypothetical protein